jgi:hypothetical protein
MFMETIDNPEAPAFYGKSNAAVTLTDDDEGADSSPARFRSSTRRRSKRPKDSTDNNQARSKYHISPRASGTRYWRREHQRSRQAEVQKPRRRPAKRSLYRADSFSV